MRKALTAAIATVITVIVLAAGFIVTNPSMETKTADAYVGITYCGDTVEDGKALIDKVKGYTNLFVLNSGLLQRDYDSVNELGDYAVNAGLYFLPYFGTYVQATFEPWLEDAKARWGDRFLGVYYGDEPAGKMLDDYVEYSDSATGDTITKTRYGDLFVEQPDGTQITYEIEGPIRLYQPSSGDQPNYEAIFYPDGSKKVVNAAPAGFKYASYQQLQTIKPFKTFEEAYQRFIDRDKANVGFLNSSTHVYTSDYDLYWYDYQAGYNVVWAQIGWNLSYTQQIAQIRGAADMQGKDWGVIITWKYQTPPYLDDATKVYSQMRNAYLCGAKYIVVFNYYESGSGAYGTMQPEHFRAVQDFWNNIVRSADEKRGSIQADSAVVFSQYYAWGARWAQDNIWGIFKADDQTALMWDTLQTAIATHGLNLDVVYADPNYPLLEKYQQIYNLTQPD
jgi:hypothetical protein